MALVTLADILVLNDKNAEQNGASDVLTVPELLKYMPAAPSSNGTKHSWVKTTQAPVVGFRSINTGRVTSKTGRSIVTADLYMLDASFIFDKLGASGLAGGEDELMALEAKAHLEAALVAFEKQLIRGQLGADADGFLGFEDAVDSLSYNGPILSAGGSEDTSGGGLTSVWFLRLDNSGVKAIAQPEVQVGPRYETFVVTNTSTGAGFVAVGKSVGAWVGLQIGDKYSIGRLCNISTDITGDHGLTDNKIGSLYSQFIPEKKPTHIVMNMRSIEQLRAARIATSPVGTEVPYPDVILGMKIIVSASVSNDESEIV